MLSILELPLSRDFDGRIPDRLFVADLAAAAEWVDQ
jgi:hypothetical protein